VPGPPPHRDRPLRALFDPLRGPAGISTTGTRWRGLLVNAIDGTIMTVADSAANLTGYTTHAGNHGGSGYPLIRVMVLVARGTRTIADAVFAHHRGRRNPPTPTSPCPACTPT
jgi:hypothetical protein